jgi:hypothetical protein
LTDGHRLQYFSHQFYHYDVDRWLEERGSDPFKATRRAVPRNDRWHPMYNGDVISMPDNWEYPWYAAWDLLRRRHPASARLVHHPYLPPGEGIRKGA